MGDGTFHSRSSDARDDLAAMVGGELPVVSAESQGEETEEGFTEIGVTFGGTSLLR